MAYCRISLASKQVADRGVVFDSFPWGQRTTTTMNIHPPCLLVQWFPYRNTAFGRNVQCFEKRQKRYIGTVSQERSQPIITSNRDFFS